MTEVTVRALGGDDWPIYRRLRLAALQDAPDAFVSSYEEEKDYDEAFWRLRMARSARLVAASEGPDPARSGAGGPGAGGPGGGGSGGGGSGGEAFGIVSVGQASEPDVAELFGLWVAPEQRGAGVAMELVEAAARQARDDGRRAIKLWVATDNGRAVAFFSSAGFRPADERRPVPTAQGSADDDAEELAMLLPVGGTPTFRTFGGTWG